MARKWYCNKCGNEINKNAHASGFLTVYKTIDGNEYNRVEMDFCISCSEAIIESCVISPEAER